VGAEPAAVFRFPDRAAKHWLLSSIIWLTVVDLFGLVLAPSLFAGGVRRDLLAELQPDPAVARERRDLAWLTMMYFGALFYMLPRLVGSARCGASGSGDHRVGVERHVLLAVIFLFDRAQPGSRVR